jgi:DNA-directed RNA polymerase subunit K/omega
MEVKKNSVPGNTVTRNIPDLDTQTGNIYESVVIIGKRANQISSEIKQELTRKLADFSSSTDSLEETFENREQIEISKYYERIPKPTLIATEEFLEGKVFFREKEEEEKRPEAEL